MTVSGTVLSIDRRHDRLVLRYGPLETAPGGVAVCALAHGGFLARLQRGDRIDALARTDHHPWLLRRARILPQLNTGQPPIASLPRTQGGDRRT
jgi:hypothetical protein